jgi:hypothetical protein
MGTKAEEYLQAYGQFAKILRTWLVAYGVGAPVLIVTNENVSKAIKDSGNAKAIAICFLVGVMLQVVLATLNKTTMWGLYYGEENPGIKSTVSYRFAFWFSETFWIEIVVDVATLLLFGIATWKAFAVLIL